MTSNVDHDRWESDENTPNFDGRQKSLEEMSAALHEMAEPIIAGERIKQTIDKAARRAGLEYWRAYDIWYRKARRVEQFEIDQITDALDKRRREVARNELHDLQARIARLEARLSQTDPDFHRPHIDALRSRNEGRRRLADGLGRLGRPAGAKT